MAPPTSYTEVTLTAWVQSELGLVGAELGWTDTASNGDFQHIVNSTMRKLGLSDIASATNMVLLEACARVEAWRAARNNLAVKADFAADGASFKDSQMHKMVCDALKSAERLLREVKCCPSVSAYGAPTEAVF